MLFNVFETGSLLALTKEKSSWDLLVVIKKKTTLLLKKPKSWPHQLTLQNISISHQKWKVETRSCLAQDKARNITVSSFCNACVSFHYLFTFVQTVCVSKKPKLIYQI